MAAIPRAAAAPAPAISFVSEVFGRASALAAAAGWAAVVLRGHVLRRVGVAHGAPRLLRVVDLLYGIVDCLLGIVVSLCLLEVIGGLLLVFGSGVVGVLVFLGLGIREVLLRGGSICCCLVVRCRCLIECLLGRLGRGGSRLGLSCILRRRGFRCGLLCESRRRRHDQCACRCSNGCCCQDALRCLRLIGLFQMLWLCASPYDFPLPSRM